MGAIPQQDETLDGLLQSVRDLLRQGEFPQATVGAKKATRRFPSSSQAWLLRGEALRLSEAYPEAMTAYEQSVAIDPGLLIAHARLAGLHLRKGAFAEAATHYCLLLEHPKDLPERMEARGDLVWFPESDDYCEPTFLERLVPLSGDAQVGFVGVGNPITPTTNWPIV